MWTYSLVILVIVCVLHSSALDIRNYSKAESKEEVANDNHAEQCSVKTYCPEGHHCCSAATCCPDKVKCCGDGLYCCEPDEGRAPSMKAMRAED